MLNNFLVNFFFNFSSLDHAFPGQYGFQYPASKAMHGIINFHHHIMFYIVIIIFFVFTLFALILEKFSIYSYSQVSNYLRIKKLYNVDLSHNSTIEII
jgi:heme/copper-type cytochrome/quinol oxidase subunit 2